jgi:hypothetical protein
VSFVTCFDWKQPKLVSVLSKTKRLFGFYTKTESFDASIEPKQTEDQPKQFDREHICSENFEVSIEPKQTEDQPKQFDREHFWVFFRKFRVIGLFQNSSVCFSCFDIGSKQTKTN